MKERTTWQHRLITKNKLSASYFHLHSYCLCSLFLRDMKNRLLRGKKQENWHTVVDKASVKIYGSRLVEENKLKQKLGHKQADSILTLLKLANEKHITL
ncbi:hypothetical protein L604_000300000280 [Bacillus subtilis J27]|nr:hypothetical protein L604_000300000280 [Bacillus subtilis J27]